MVVSLKTKGNETEQRLRIAARFYGTLEPTLKAIFGEYGKLTW